MSPRWGGHHEGMQILTVADVLGRKKPNVPKFVPGYQKRRSDRREDGRAAVAGTAVLVSESHAV